MREGGREGWGKNSLFPGEDILNPMGGGGYTPSYNGYLSITSGFQTSLGIWFFTLFGKKQRFHGHFFEKITKNDHKSSWILTFFVILRKK